MPPDSPLTAFATPKTGAGQEIDLKVKKRQDQAAARLRKARGGAGETSGSGEAAKVWIDVLLDSGIVLQRLTRDQIQGMQGRSGGGGDGGGGGGGGQPHPTFTLNPFEVLTLAHEELEAIR